MCARQRGQLGQVTCYGCPVTKERRVHPRFDVMAQIHLYRGRVDSVMEVINLSAGGALVDMGTLDRPAKLDVGAVVSVGLTNPETLELVELKAKVVRLEVDDEGSRFAVNFEPLSADARDAVRRLLATGRPSEGPPPLPPNAS